MLASGEAPCVGLEEEEEEEGHGAERSKMPGAGGLKNTRFDE